MATGTVADDDSFELDASDGRMTVQRGMAVFEVEDKIFACAPKYVSDKLALAAGTGNAVVSGLVAKESTRIEQKREVNRRNRPTSAGGDQPLRIKPVIGTPPAPQFAPIEALAVDDTYQRSIEGGSSQKLIVKIAENWDWRLCLPLLVSRRGGQLYVIDGQHRKEAAELRGDIPHLPVVVFDFDDPKAEAALFVAANRSRRAMSKLDDFHAAVVAGDARAIAANEVVRAAGLTVGRIQAWQYWKPGEVVFVTAIQRTIHTHGKAIALSALTTIAKAFDGLVLTGVGAIFDALSTLIHETTKAGQPLDLELMQIVLSETGIPGWKQAVEEIDNGRDRADAMLSALRAAYAEAGAE